MALISEVIRSLQKQQVQHGDIEVVLYDSGTRKPSENEILDFDIEFNADNEDPAVLISF